MPSPRAIAPGRSGSGVAIHVVTGAVVLAMTVGAGCVRLVGTVYIDRNGDGLRQDDEPVVPGVVVARDRTEFVITDAEGRYQLAAPGEGGIVWARVPAGFRPGPVWRQINGLEGLDLGLTPLTDAEARSPVTFVVAADSHVTAATDEPWDGGDVDGAIAQALDLPEPARFFTIVGDITQSNKPEQFARINRALPPEVPWVPVAGNHDWYDGGQEYRRTYGIDNYSFDIDELHFIVWDTNLPEEDQLRFVTEELARVPLSTTVIALGHASPTAAVADEFARLGVDYLFTGHWHANRRVDRADGLVEWGTQTFTMGGIDASPSGYRVVTFDGPVPAVVHREVLVEPHLDLTMPRPDTCVSTPELEIVAAVATGAPEVTARIDCGPALALTRDAQGWAYRATAPALTNGVHNILVTATTPGGAELSRQVAFEVCSDPMAAVPTTTSWPQLGGGPTHTGYQPAPIGGPLTTAWATALGGTPALGSPVIDQGIVVVSMIDRGAGDRGGLVAVDLLTGALRWRVATHVPVANAPAIADGTVVAALSDGEVWAYDLLTGQERWRVELGRDLDPLESTLWAAPTIAGGVVYAGVQGNFAALDLVTGEVLWSRDPAPPYPWLGSRAAAAVANDTVVAALNRTLGLASWGATSGGPAWGVQTGATAAINATPVVADDVVYVASAAGDVTALDLADGRTRWSVPVTPGGFDWGYSIVAAPAYADGRLFVPTQWNELVALDAASGGELWHAISPASPLNTAHYRWDSPGFIASPVVTGDIVWVGRPDGTLLALAAADGRELWSTELGAPIVTAPAPAGDLLVVITYDGTIRALRAGATVNPPPPEACAPEEPRPDAVGCGCAGQPDPAAAGGLVVVVALVIARRRRRPALGRL